MTTLPDEPVQKQFAPTLNPQFRGAEPAALLHAAGTWLEAHPDVAVVALNLINFDLFGHNPHGNGFLWVILKCAPMKISSSELTDAGTLDR